MHFVVVRQRTAVLWPPSTRAQPAPPLVEPPQWTEGRSDLKRQDDWTAREKYYHALAERALR
jgi:hypothetical protein